MKILAIEREVSDVDFSAFTPELARAEALQAWRLYQEGSVRELYFRADKTEAVLILECASVEEAAATLATLPMVAAGLVAFDLIPLKAYPGFARLFAESA
jgi:muconolactone delta-isomerase